MAVLGDRAESADRPYSGAQMTVQELDRFISKTELNPASKRALKAVRSSIQSGTAGEPGINSIEWSVGIQTEGGYPARMTFSWKRE